MKAFARELFYGKNISLSVKKISFQPFFILFFIFFLFTGKGFSLLYLFLALIMHEFSHYFVARRRGYILRRFTLSPFGATLSYDSGLTGADELAVTVAGPLSNLLLCPLIVASWWIFPSSYPFTLPLFKANFFLGLYNVLPIFPFDGGRIILSLVKNKKKAYAVLRIVGVVLSCFLFSLGVYLFLFYKVFTVLVAAVCIFWNCLFPPVAEKYRLIFDQIGIYASAKPMERRDIYVRSDVSVSLLLRSFKRSNVYYVVHVLFPSSAEKVVCGEKLNRLYFVDKRLKVGEIF